LIKFGNMPWTAIKEAANATPNLSIILPVGSLEQHGPHLPLNTDSIIAEYVADKVSNKLSSILFPTMSIGYSLEHSGFPGTISFTSHTFSSTIAEITEGLYESGFRTLIAINGHGGNRPILDSSIISIKHAHPDLRLYSFTTLDIAREKFKDHRKSPRNLIGHADELETSMMLALRPDLVEMDKALTEKPAFPPGISLESEDLSRVTYGWRTKEVTDSGIIGSPNFATPETGRILLDYVVQTICSIVGER
jgi:creatinine amidohydrolase